MDIDGWVCLDMWPGTDWHMRTATKGKVEWEATAEGLRLEERSSGYCGYSGSYGLSPNVAIWLMQAVR